MSSRISPTPAPGPVISRPSLLSSSSDEPLVIPTPARAAATTDTSQDEASAGPSRAKGRSRSGLNGKGGLSSSSRLAKDAQGRAERPMVILDDTDGPDMTNRSVQYSGDVVPIEVEEDDEPVFMGRAIGKLAEKYTFAGSSTSLSRSPSVGAVTEAAVDAGTGSGAPMTEEAVSSRSTSKAKGKGTPKGQSKGRSKPATSPEHVKGELPTQGELTPSGKGKRTPRAKAVKKPTKTKGNAAADPIDLSATLPLLPDLALEPAPVPPWLGKTAVLLQLPACVVCKVRFKKSDSGAGRWRHMSICRPPLFRPPNPPPDLQYMIHEALQALSAPSEPSSLLDLHVRLSTPECLPAGERGQKKKILQAGLLGLKSFTNVKATSERGEQWDEEVRERVREFIGPSSPAASCAESPPPGSINPRSVERHESEGADLVKNETVWRDHDTESETEQPPSTLPLGGSSLAQIYGRPGRSSSPATSLLTQSGSPSRSRSPMTPTPASPVSISISLSSRSEGDAPPPSSQKRRLSNALVFADGPDECRLDLSADYLEPKDADNTEPVYTVSSSSDEDVQIAHDDTWGDDAILSWVGDAPHPTIKAPSPTDIDVWSVASSVSSVPASEAGLSVDSDGDELGDMGAEDDWGKDAQLEWGFERHPGELFNAGQVDSSEQEEVEEIELDRDFGESSEEEEQVEMDRVETEEDMVARGMPKYAQWDYKKLHRLVTGYGFRSSNDMTSLRKVAVQCWLATHPPPPVRKRPTEPKKKRTAKSRADTRQPVARDSSVSSADMPLAQVKSTSRAKSRSQSKSRSAALLRTAVIDLEPGFEGNEDSGSLAEAVQPSQIRKGKGKEKGKEKPIKLRDADVNLDKEFYHMIMSDQALWLRVLQYEPISFDELVSRSFAAGIDKLKRSWKKDLKRYLDLQSISFFSEDPTGQRRRH
ncbi:hypothetical protein IAU60_001439 [Kwoniella sp. DSM 27419]